MIDSRGEYDPMRETESLVRSASNYVRVSPDFRPRLIEAARLGVRERRARRIIRHIVVAAAIIAWGVTTSIGRMKATYTYQALPIAEAGAFPISYRATSIGGEDWTLVDAFTELRDKQAGVLRY